MLYTPPENSISTTARLLNLGCGRRFHPDWTNVDLEPCQSDVIAHDILQGLPFDDYKFDGVYHSHVLEHLSPEDGQTLLAECFRVLRPGGVLRIVVPDLEQIARLYLQMHRQAWHADEAQPDYDWIKLELLDQLVRDSSGGKMGQYMSQRAIENEEFVRSRLGDEFMLCRSHRGQQDETYATFSARFSQSVSKIRKQMSRTIVGWLMGAEGRQAFDEGLFRRQGEVHRWMYDRYSLRQLCQTVGFEAFEVVDAESSLIPNFSSYQLDSIDGDIRKPDSLFVECQKPA